MTSPLLGDLTDPVSIAQSLIRIDSTVPGDSRPPRLIAQMLQSLGFQTTEHRDLAPDGQTIHNLLAHRISDSAVHTDGILLAGHTDVVPSGDPSSWIHPPFEAHITSHHGLECLFGRGAVDMKGGIACQIAAVARAQLGSQAAPLPTLSLIIASDEETHGVHGTRPTLRAAKDQGLRWRFAINAEPTSDVQVGDMIKIGRRGSVNLRITTKGQRAHTAYQNPGGNAAHRLALCIAGLSNWSIDHGDPPFEPTSLQTTTLSVPHGANNVVPETATAHVNLRFPPNRTVEELRQRVWDRCATQVDPTQVTVEMIGVPAQPFYSDQTAEVSLLKHCAQDVLGTACSTGVEGGTSDSRHIADFCPVVDAGLRHHTIHQINEHTPVTDLEQLTQWFTAFLQRVESLR